MNRTSRITAIALCISLSACANTGATYRPMIDAGVGNPANYEADLSQCQQYAAQLAGAAQNAMAGAIVGALIGAALGAAVGHGVSRNTLAGVGAVDGAVAGGVQGETDQRNVIRRCMAGRGYSVLQ